MNNNRVNLLMFCVLSLMLSLSDSLQAMGITGEVKQNVEKLKRTKECPGCNLEGAKLGKADLTFANLKNANLRLVDLNWADLPNANLEGANLEGAKLPNANLEGANFYNANLEGANLYNANLYNANLKGANLEGALGMTDDGIIGSGAILDKNTTLPSGKKYQP